MYRMGVGGPIKRQEVEVETPEQQDTPPRFGGSVWSDGRKIIVSGNTLDDVFHKLRMHWERRTGG